MYEKALSGIGLDVKQARVYTACLELGPSKIPAIAREADIKRTSCYGIVDELVSLGLVSVSYKGKTKLFGPTDPETLTDLLEERKRKIASIMPELSDLFLTRNVRPKVTFFEGREGLRKIYDDLLECKSKHVKMIARVRHHNEAVGDAFVKDFIRKRIAKGIIAQVLHPKSGDLYGGGRGVEDPKQKRQVRYLPPNVFYAAIIMIYDYKVAMVSTKAENFGFIIESKEFSNTLSAYFDLMWGLGSKEPDFS